jgi:hypothetical protein
MQVIAVFIPIRVPCHYKCVNVTELVYVLDLKSNDLRSCGFDPHHSQLNGGGECFYPTPRYG